MSIHTGYPTSGPHANPEQYDLAQPVHIDVDPMLVEAHPWSYPYYPPYPVVFKKNAETELRQVAKSVVKSEDVNALVPGRFILFTFWIQEIWNLQEATDSQLTGTTVHRQQIFSDNQNCRSLDKFYFQNKTI